jgi:integrase
MRTPALIIRAGVQVATPTGLEPAAFAVTGRRANQLRYGARWCTEPVGPVRYCTGAVLQFSNADISLRCTPNGIRTRATAVKGRRPRPLDDGGPSPGA